ncbi:MAG: cyclic nucleotide-binding domain-containing protein [Cycloclasticus sp.]|nr:cyclic nucleotide-binding domain-containing protein [Cycloclasticus sp.]
MSARRHQNNQDILKNFIPLNTLPSARLTSIFDKCHVEELDKGAVLFEQGDEAKEFIYLISGMVSLYAGEMEIETIVTGSEVARFAIAHHLPRKVKAVTRSKARVVRIPTHMLDMETPEDNGQTYMVDEVEDQGGDWMTTMLQSPVFQRLPATNLQKVMMQMEEVAFAAGDDVVKQGDEADFYYIIKTGDCELIRQASDESRPIKLGELHSCDAFGEDALLSGNPRNVTVRMKGKGQMLRLSKSNFIALVKEPVLQYVDFEEGQKKVTGGANWLDVRSVDEYEEGSIEGSVNIPFFSLRMKIPELRHDQLQVLVCANGRTSEAAAFLLLKFGFNALILKGGMAKWGGEIAVGDTLAKGSVSAAPATLKETDVTTIPVANTKAEQSKIIELEKLCAQSNEKINTLTIERNSLQQQYEQQSNLVSELQMSSQTFADELEAIRSHGEKREIEIGQLLALEREKSAALQTEIDQFHESFDVLNADVSVKDNELITLKSALANTEKEKEEAVNKLGQQLLAAKQEVADLVSQKESINASAEEARREVDQLSQSKLLLEQQIEQSVQDLSLGVSEKETRISELSADLYELRSSLADAEQSKVIQEKNLLELTAELEQVKESEKKAIEALKVESEARAEKLENELRGLKQELAEKTINLEEKVGSVREFKTQIESLKEKNKNAESIVLEKNAEIDAFTGQLNAAEANITTLEQQQSDFASSLAEKEAALADSGEKLASINDERAVLKKKLEQSGDKLTSLSAERSELEKRLNEALESINRLKSDEQAALTQADSLKQQNEKAEKALEKSAEELRQSDAQVQKLEQESEELSEQVKRLQASLNEINSGKATVESELTQRLTDSDNKLTSVLESKREVEKQLDNVTNEQVHAQQKLLELEAQLEAGLDDRRELNEKLTQVQEELELVRQEGDEEKAELSESLLQANARFEETEAVLKQLSEEQAIAVQQHQQQLAKIESDLVVTKAAKEKVELTLESVESEKELAEQALLALQGQVDNDLGEQQHLKEQLAQAQQQNEVLTQSQKALELARQEGDEEKAKLSESLLQANARFEETEAVLKQLSEEQAIAVQQHQQQLAKIESDLVVTKAAKEKVELTLESVESEKELAEQALLALQGQVDNDLGERQQLKEQLAQAQQKIDEGNKEREEERVNWVAALEQSKEQLVALEGSSIERLKQVEEKHANQVSGLESELERVNGENLSSNEELASAHADNKVLQQKLMDAETILSASTGDQKALLAQLDEARTESAGFKKVIESNQAKLDTFVDVKIELEEALAESKNLFEESCVATEKAELRCNELSSALEALSSEQQAETRLLNEQLAELGDSCQQYEKEVRVLGDSLQATEASLSSAVSEKEALLLQLEELEQGKLSDSVVVQALEQKITELEQSLQQLEEEKERVIADVGKGGNEKVVQLTEQLLAAQNETKQSLKQLNEAMSACEAEAKAKVELADKLKVMTDESDDLRRNLKDAQRAATKNTDSSLDQARIKELEKQLNEASTMLLDLEIKMESAAVDADDDYSEVETDELKALQSELNLVREQTEKDIQAMQLKVQNSEKMNLALKKKILSMQTLANQEVLPDEPPQEKKKGWWK